MILHRPRSCEFPLSKFCCRNSGAGLVSSFRTLILSEDGGELVSTVFGRAGSDFINSGPLAFEIHERSFEIKLC